MATLDYCPTNTATQPPLFASSICTIMDHLLLKIRLLLLSWFHLHPSPPGPISLLTVYSLCELSLPSVALKSSFSFSLNLEDFSIFEQYPLRIASSSRSSGISIVYVGTGIKYQKPLEMSGMLKQAKLGCGFLRDWNYNWKNVIFFFFVLPVDRLSCDSEEMKIMVLQILCTICFARRFSYRDIKKATDGFRRIIDNSHGAAYKAIFQDGSVAMVKEIRDFDEEEEAFYKEVLLLGCLHHRHIVSLCGFSTGRKRFLVFENIENGTLKDHLNDPLKTPLNWRTRLHIVIGVAAALEYLYFFCNPPMYHVSVSSSTILLDENYNAKLCNIGILGSRPNNVTLPQSSCTKGKLLRSLLCHYFCVSSKFNLHVSLSSAAAECDGQECGNVIFQLGLLILELITGQSSEDGGAELIQWVQEYRFSKTVHKVLDPDLGDNYDSRELKGLLAVARLCTKSVDKPTAFTPQVFRYLQKKIGIAVA
ncbi:hypothetical protein RHMOL_Rhmol13G0265300 [Rhododendron molle]|uniref:Uncharacterized protein n=1 Tax=Rhododendron molle TaxID=49168 RepID=A0ACC0LAX9_RHOML|nr:hypothetical protein RHMOL_Rhmol13G0265300 [Rhododendron molle]